MISTLFNVKTQDMISWENAHLYYATVLIAFLKNYFWGTLITRVSLWHFFWGGFWYEFLVWSPEKARLAWECLKTSENLKASQKLWKIVKVLKSFIILENFKAPEKLRKNMNILKKLRKLWIRFIILENLKAPAKLWKTLNL